MTIFPASTDRAASLSQRVATRVRMLMAARRATNRELAEVLGLSERAAQRRRQGHLEFSLSELELVANWLEVDPAALLSGRGIGGGAV
ncbi:helix-turn-helix transcriptional regulator [Leifsonia sp. F6_8S_P_1B]|uniref:Helix-turn-helix transcriptional regulator n=1 Tax=Leifsonia williamsii TaxID=3035919 RepID=A0ABT8KEU6_9MICO|nr:helix-turn-helix transcriptional regulator [Leifsonia williamsii]MDN4615963.1 helix-turn-helix transcriptional regulator [Leifsonia williamsii]